MPTTKCHVTSHVCQERWFCCIWLGLDGLIIGNGFDDRHLWLLCWACRGVDQEGQESERGLSKSKETSRGYTLLELADGGWAVSSATSMYSMLSKFAQSAGSPQAASRIEKRAEISAANGQWTEGDQSAKRSHRGLALSPRSFESYELGLRTAMIRDVGGRMSSASLGPS